MCVCVCVCVKWFLGYLFLMFIAVSSFCLFVSFLKQYLEVWTLIPLFSSQLLSYSYTLFVVLFTSSSMLLRFSSSVLTGGTFSVFFFSLFRF